MGALKSKKSNKTNTTISNYPKIRILVVGDTGVGKSSLLSRYVHNTYPTKPSTESQPEQILINGCKVEIATYNPTPRFRTYSFPYRGIHAIAVCFDMNSIETFENVSRWLIEIERYADDDVVVVIVGCKADFLAEPPPHTFVPFLSTNFPANWYQDNSILCLSDFFTHLTPFLTIVHLKKLRAVCKWLYNTTLSLVKQFINENNTEVKEEEIMLLREKRIVVVLTSSKHNIGVNDLFTIIVQTTLQNITLVLSDFKALD